MMVSGKAWTFDPESCHINNANTINDMTNKLAKEQKIKLSKQKAERELDRQIREALEKDKD